MSNASEQVIEASTAKEEKVKGEVNAYVIIAVLIILATLATWLVPAGQYDRVKDAATGRQVVVAGSFHTVTQAPVGPWEMFKLIQKGFIEANVIILFVLVVGGSFGLLTHTGSITALIAKALKLPKSAVRISAGHTARVKRLEIEGATSADIALAFGSPSGEA